MRDFLVRLRDRRWPLRYTIPVALAMLGIVLTGIAFYGGWKNARLLIEDEMQARMVALGTRISSVVEDRYTRGEADLAAEAVLRSVNERYLERAVLADPTGKMIASTDYRLRDSSIAPLLDGAPDFAKAWSTAVDTMAAQYRWSTDRQRLYGLFPMRMERSVRVLRSRPIGVLLLEMNLEEIKRIDLSKHLQRAWIMGGVILLSLGVVWFYLNRVVTERLSRIAEAVEHTAAGHGKSDNRMPEVDELGRFGQSIHRIVAELHARTNALGVSEARYRGVIHAMSEGVAMLNSSEQIIAANESAARIVGMTQKDLIGRNAADSPWRIVGDNGAPLPMDEFPPIVTLRTGLTLSNVVLGIRRSDGELRWISINSEPLTLDAIGERGAVCTITDITERRKVELGARRDRERLAAIIDSAMDGVISTDSAMRITVFNRAAEKIFGHTEDEMLGQSIDRLVPEHFRELHAMHMHRFAETGSTARGMGMPGNVTGRRANGEEFPLEASISRVNIDGEIVLTVILRDVSERLRAEEQRSQLEAQLRQSQKMQSLGTLTGGIAHDFNNILTAISGNIKLAKDDLPAGHAVQRSLAEVEKAAARATDLVRQVLAFGRRQEAQRVAADMTLVVGDALNFLRAMLPATIEIRTHFATELPQVAVDRTQVHQVITNLGSNAAHAIGDKPGRIEVSLNAVRLTENEAQRSPDLRAGQYLLLDFADTGAGIHPAIVDRIFEPFFTTKEPGHGTGLGLSVVHGIMKSHDGAIVVHSDPNAGSRFELYFPACTQQATQPPVELPSRVTPSGRGKTVMYVDDEEALVYLVTRMLERQGYTVLGFNTPRAALADLKKNPRRVDALISDLAMPGMTGFDVAREALQLRNDLPIVLVSGYLRPQDIETARTLGVQKLILKPDTVDGLAAALHDVLSNRVAETAL